MSAFTDNAEVAAALEYAKRQFDGGDRSGVLASMYLCMFMKVPPPEWLRDAFIEAYESVASFEAKSWDDAFGKPHPKGARLKDRKKHAELAYPIILRVQQLAASGKSIDKELFEKVGAELKPTVSGSTASDIYYDDCNQGLREHIKQLLPYLKNS